MGDDNIKRKHAKANEAEGTEAQEPVYRRGMAGEGKGAMHLTVSQVQDAVVSGSARIP